MYTETIIIRSRFLRVTVDSGCALADYHVITLELRHVEIIISPSARIVQLAKTKAITHFFFDPRDSLLGQPF